MEKKEITKRQKQNTKPKLLWNVLYIVMQMWVIGKFIHNQVTIEQPQTQCNRSKQHPFNHYKHICIMFSMVY